VKTPYTDKGLVQYDGLEPLDAVIKAWTEPGPHPAWHEETKRVVRDAMPLLARALDRLTEAAR
jgi:hypothetical protein